MAYGWYNSSLPVPGVPFILVSASDNSVTIDSNGDRVAGVFQAETTDAITHVGYRQGTTTGSPGVLRISLQGVDSSGNPDGTVKGGGSPASTTFTPAGGGDNTWIWRALDNSYTPAALGELSSWVIDRSSGTFDGSNNVSILRSNNAMLGVSLFPYTLSDTTGSWAKGTGSLFGYKTASARFGHYCQAVTMQSVTTSGHRRALAFTFDGEGAASYKLIGCNAVVDFPASGNIKFGLWNSGGLLASATLGNSQVQNNTLDRVAHIYFDTYATLTPGTKYYIGCEADGNAFEVAQMEFAEAEDIGAWVSDYTKLALATFDGSSWSETATSTAMVQPIIQAVTGKSAGLGMVIGG